MRSNVCNGRRRESRPVLTPGGGQLGKRRSGSPEPFRRIVEAARNEVDDAANSRRQVADRPATLEETEAQLDRADHLLERIRHELATVAQGFLRGTLPNGACAVPWPVCHHCLGAGLGSSAGSSWCRSCGRSGGPGSTRSAFLCPRPGTVTVRDLDGDDARMCLSHASGALRDVAGLTVVDATDDELLALFVNSHRPVKVDISRRARPSWPSAIEQ